MITLFSSCKKEQDENLTRCYTCIKHYNVDVKLYNLHVDHPSITSISGYPQSSTVEDYLCNISQDDKVKYQNTYTFDKQTYYNLSGSQYGMFETQTCDCH